MRFEVHHYHHLSPSLEHLAMTISAEVSGLLDQARQTQSLVKSVDIGLKAQGLQITDLQAQIAALQAGAPLSADDKAALAEAASDLSDANTTLQSDIPANTPQASA